MTANVSLNQRHDSRISSSVSTATNSRTKSSISKNKATKRLRADDDISSDTDVDEELILKTFKVFNEKLIGDGTHFFESKKKYDELDDKLATRLSTYQLYMDAYESSGKIDSSLSEQLDDLNVKIYDLHHAFATAHYEELIQNVNTILQYLESGTPTVLRSLDKILNKQILKIKYEEIGYNFSNGLTERTLQTVEEKLNDDALPRAQYAMNCREAAYYRRYLARNRVKSMIIEHALVSLDTIKNSISTELMNAQVSEGILLPSNDVANEVPSRLSEVNENADNGSLDNEDQNTLGEDDDGPLANAKSSTLNTIVTPDVALLIQAIESGSAQKVSRVIRQVSPFVDTVLDGKYKEKMWTPIHLAADLGDPDVIEAVMLLNPSLDFQDMDGNTPLMLAALKGHQKAVSMLLDYGADVAKINDNNQSVKEIAKTEPSKKIKPLFEQLERQIQEDDKRKVKAPQAKKLKKK